MSAQPYQEPSLKSYTLAKISAFVLFLLLPSVVFAQGFGQLYADKAYQIKTRYASFGKFLPTSATTVQSALDYINTNAGSGSGGITSIFGQDESVGIGTFTTLNFVGASVTSVISNNVMTATIQGGGAGGSPGGANTQVQFNDSSTFGGNPNFVFTKATGNVGIGTDLNGASGRLTVIGNVGIGTLTAGSQLTLFSSTGNKAIDVVATSNYHAFQVDAAGTVGIGTAVPDVSYTLDVNGPASFHSGNLDFVAGNALNSFNIYNQAGTRVMQLGAQNVGNPVILNSGTFVGTTSTVNRAGLYAFSNVGVGTYFNQDSAMTVMSGNVGIGTWKPFTALDVKGTVLASLNVGIGTLRPLAMLHVGNGGNEYAGDAGITISRNLTGTGSAHGINDSTDIDRSGSIGYNAFGASTHYAGVENYDHHASFQTQMNYNSSGTLTNAYGYFYTLVVNSGTVTNAYGLYLNPTSGVGTITKNWGVYAPSAAQRHYFAGNVGIGTTAVDPQYVLDVQDTTANTHTQSTTGTNYVVHYFENTSGVLRTGIDSSTGGSVFVGSLPYAAVFGNNSANPVQFATNNSVKATITATGNVGINTTVPPQMLYVAGTVEAQGFKMARAPTNGYVLTTDANGVGSWAVSSGAGGTAAGGLNAVQYNSPVGTFAGASNIFSFNGTNVGIGTTNGVNILDVRGTVSIQSGNVGIGSITPGATVDVQGTSRLTSSTNKSYTQNFTTTVTGQAMSFGNVTNGEFGAVSISSNPGNPFQVYGVTNHNLQLGGSSNVFVTMDSTNVGINSVTPGASLDVSGDIRSRGTSKHIFGDDNKAYLQASATTAPDIKFVTNSAEIMRVNNVGNVGIGTINPQFPLQIVGNVGIGTTIASSTPYALNINNVATFNSQFSYASNIGIGTTTINWNNGNYQNIGIGTNGTNTYIIFTHPSGLGAGVAKLQLRILQDGTGSRDLPLSGSWPATIKWSGGIQPTLTPTAAKADSINCTWNGTSDECMVGPNF